MEEIDELQGTLDKERVHIESLNKLITADLLPVVDALVQKYRIKYKNCRKCRCRRPPQEEEEDDEDDEESDSDEETNEARDVTKELGVEIYKLLPMEETKWFSDTYEFGTSPMLDLYMSDAAILILKLYKWCYECTPQEESWKDLIPCYMRREMKKFREMSG
jgi:hypothetical protein